MSSSTSNVLSRATALAMKISEVAKPAWLLGNSYVLCKDEPFQDQPLRGFCSGVLIAPNQVLTAGHCIRKAKDCAETTFTFNLTMERARSPLATSDLYSCKQILSHEYKSSYDIWGWDYTIVELDRAVENISPVSLAPATKQLKVGDSVVSYSYPLGLPLKQDIGKVLSHDPRSNFLRVSVDTFSVSSGSPLYNSHGELIGILSSGASDFLQDELEEARRNRTCARFQRCDEAADTPDCSGELFFKTSLIK
ncbi:Trypsin [compost metagenome]